MRELTVLARGGMALCIRLRIFPPNILPAVMAKIRDSVPKSVLEELCRLYGKEYVKLLKNAFDLNDRAESLVKDLKELNMSESYDGPKLTRHEIMEKVWNGAVRTSGSNMIKRTFHCYPIPINDYRPDVTVTTWSDNGKIHAYLWKLNEKFDTYELVGAEDFGKAGWRECQVETEIREAAARKVFGDAYQTTDGTKRTVELLPYRDMLW
jgi:hypothetical protein